MRTTLVPYLLSLAILINASPIRVGMIQDWEVYHSGVCQLQPSKIVYPHYTHIVVSLANYDSTSRTFQPNSAGESITLYQDLKSNIGSLNATTKLVISTLGYNDRGIIEEITTNDASLQSFTTGIIQYADQYGFQGIDLGWPWTGGDGPKALKVVTAIRAAITSANKTLSLSIQTTADSSMYFNLNLPEISRQVDWMLVTSTGYYDYYSVGYNGVGSPSPLPAVKTTVVDMLTMIPQNKIVMGTVNYGVRYNLTDPTRNTPGSAATIGVVGCSSDPAGRLSASEVELLAEDASYTLQYNADNMMAYLLKEDQWISYETAQTVQDKIEYFVSQSLGGVMIAFIGQSDRIPGFISASYESFNNQTAKEELKELHDLPTNSTFLQKSGVMLGIFPDFSQYSTEDVNGAFSRTNLSDVAVVGQFLDMSTSAGEVAAEAWEIVKSYSPKSSPQPAYLLTIQPKNTDIPSDNSLSTFNSTMALRLVEQLKELSHVERVWVRWGHEMNGNYYQWSFGSDAPTLYINAWRLLYKTIKDSSLTNVKMVWSPNFEGAQDLNEFFPGDDYVDLYGVSVYWFGSDYTKYLRNEMPTPNYFMKSVQPYHDAYPLKYGKPFFVSETSAPWNLNWTDNTITEVEMKREWMSQLFGPSTFVLKQYIGALWFNYLKVETIATSTGNLDFRLVMGNITDTQLIDVMSGFNVNVNQPANEVSSTSSTSTSSTSTTETKPTTSARTVPIYTGPELTTDATPAAGSISLSPASWLAIALILLAFY